jgi:hypothetical protein
VAIGTAFFVARAMPVAAGTAEPESVQAAGDPATIG